MRLPEAEHLRRRLLGRYRRGHRNRWREDHLRRGARLRTMPCTQAELVHYSAHMVRIVADAIAHLDGRSEARGSPAVVGKASGAGAGTEKIRDALLLFQVEAARPARGSTLTQRLHALTMQRAMPARCRSPAHPKFTCDLGLG